MNDKELNQNDESELPELAELPESALASAAGGLFIMPLPPGQWPSPNLPPIRVGIYPNPIRF
jgi:hypothetical protein